MTKSASLVAVVFTSVLGATLGTTGAETAAGVTESETAALNDAISRWNRLGAANYGFDFQNMCNCARGATAKMRIEISDGKVSSVRYTQDVNEHHYIDGEDRYVLVHGKGSHVPNEFAKNLVPVGPFLLEMRRQIGQPIAEYEAEFDAKTGAPCRVFFDFSGPLVDDELEIILSNFEFEETRNIHLQGVPREN